MKGILRDLLRYWGHRSARSDGRTSIRRFGCTRMSAVRSCQENDLKLCCWTPWWTAWTRVTGFLLQQG